GRGNTAATADAFNVPMEDSEARAVEALDVILRAWEGEEFSYKGDYYSFDPLKVTPFPVQAPHPPIYWAAVSPGSHERGGTGGYNLLTGASGLDWSQLKRRIDRFIDGWATRNGQAEHGKVRVNVHGFCAPTSKQAHDAYQGYVVEYV